MEKELAELVLNMKTLCSSRPFDECILDYKPTKYLPDCEAIQHLYNSMANIKLTSKDCELPIKFSLHIINILIDNIINLEKKVVEMETITNNQDKHNAVILSRITELEQRLNIKEQQIIKEEEELQRKIKYVNKLEREYNQKLSATD